MPPLSRKQFLGVLLSAPTKKGKATGKDMAFEEYANKVLPAARTTTVSLNEYTGDWTEVQIMHLLRRTMFGVKQSEIDALKGMTMSSAVDLLLTAPASAPAPPINNYTVAGGTDIAGIGEGQTWINTSYGDANLNFTRIFSLKSWWMGLAINQGLSIVEKMVFFWHNHFATQYFVIEDARYGYNNNALLRSNALGNFKTLVKAVTYDPAMLKYLNGYVNTKNNPDENYARELQELFTLGKGNTPNYTEDDVKAAAKILTGWTIDSSSFASYFTPHQHDATDKQFSSFFNNRLIAGQTGSSGANETDALIEMIFAKNEVAHFICTKLYRFFVYYNIDADIDANIIYPLAQLLIDSNFEVKPVLLKLLKSQHFFDANSIGCYIKTPLDFYIGMLRTFEVDLSAATSNSDLYAIWNTLYSYSDVSGLSLGDPPNVAGWPAFSQSPAYYQFWINSSTLPTRMEFADAMLSTGVATGTDTPLAIDALKFASLCPSPADPDELINWMTALLLGVSVADSEKTAMKNILLSGQADSRYWTEAWGSYVADPNAEHTGVVVGRLRALLTSLLRMPEFQLC